MMASGEKLKDIHPQPGLCKLVHGLENLNLVDSKFGPVPFGSVLSYQCTPEISVAVLDTLVPLRFRSYLLMATILNSHQIVSSVTSNNAIWRA